MTDHPLLAHATRLTIVDALLRYAEGWPEVEVLFAHAATKREAVAELQRAPFLLSEPAADAAAHAPLWMRTSEGRAELEAERTELARLLGR